MKCLSENGGKQSVKLNVCIDIIHFEEAGFLYQFLSLQDVGMDVYEIKNFRKRDGGKMIKADAHQIVQSGNKWAMLYAVKRT